MNEMNQIHQGRTVREERIRQRRRHLCSRAPAPRQRAGTRTAPPGPPLPPAWRRPRRCPYLSPCCATSVLRTPAVQTFSSILDTIRARTLSARTSPFGHVMKQTNTLLDGRSAGAAAAGAACAGARGDVRERGREYSKRGGGKAWGGSPP
jgi:hypothetical protein